MTTMIDLGGVKAPCLPALPRLAAPASLIAEALRLPTRAAIHDLGRSLAGIFPGRHVLHSTDSDFDPLGLAHAGLCRLALAEGVEHEHDACFVWSTRSVVPQPTAAWFAVDHDGKALLVLVVVFTEGDSKTEAWWVVGPDAAATGAFFKHACEFRCSVDPQAEILVWEGGSAHKSRELLAAVRASSFDNLVMPAPLKAAIREDFRRFFSAREMYARYGVPWKRGVILAGPPGNGKTHTIKALVNELGCACIYVKSFSSECMNARSGVRAVFSRARGLAPCMLVLEDLDTLVTDENRSFFLNELDGFAANHGLVVVATTNHPERLDPALAERPSRFDRKYLVPLPEGPERRAYLALWSASVERAMQLSPAGVDQLAEATGGFSYAFLKELTLSAMMRWVSDAREEAMDAVMLAEAAALRRQMTPATMP